MPLRHPRYFEDATGPELRPAAFQHAVGTGPLPRAARYGDAGQRKKTCLILEHKRFDYQKYCSDLAGQDISAHASKPERAIAAVRNFLGAALATNIPGPAEMCRRYGAFTAALPQARRTLKLKKSEVGYKEYTNMVAEWLKLHPRP